jgi:hypothetical protein
VLILKSQLIDKSAMDVMMVVLGMSACGASAVPKLAAALGHVPEWSLALHLMVLVIVSRPSQRH